MEKKNTHARTQCSVYIKFINLAKYGEIIADNVVRFESRPAESWIVPLYKKMTVLFILD